MFKGKAPPQAATSAASPATLPWDGPRWQYMRQAAASAEEFVGHANTLGDRGWELVSVYVNQYSKPPGISQTTTMNVIGIFKRSLPPSSEPAADPQTVTGLDAP